MLAVSCITWTDKERVYFVEYQSYNQKDKITCLRNNLFLLDMILWHRIFLIVIFFRIAQSNRKKLILTSWQPFMGRFLFLIMKPCSGSGGFLEVVSRYSLDSWLLFDWVWLRLLITEADGTVRWFPDGDLPSSWKLSSELILGSGCSKILRHNRWII